MPGFKCLTSLLSLLAIVYYLLKKLSNITFHSKFYHLGVLECIKIN